MSDERNAPRQAIRAAVRELEDLRGRILELADRLAPRGEESGEDEPLPAEAVLRCVVLDRLEPAIRDLTGAAGSLGRERGEERPQ